MNDEHSQIMDLIRDLNSSVMKAVGHFDSRLTAMEKSCSDSHAPYSAGSGGTTLSPSTETGAGSSATPSPLKSADAATGSSDSARRALADPDRPAWLTREAASTLPEGTERVYLLNVSIVAVPSMKHYVDMWRDTANLRDEKELLARCSVHEVYHLPPPAKGEGDAYTRWVEYRASFRDSPTRPVERDLMNSFVAGECERAVKALEPKFHDVDRFYEDPPKPDAGRAEGVNSKTPGAVHCTNIGCGYYVLPEYGYCPKCGTGLSTPAPKPSPGEVAEVVTKQIVQAVEMGGKVDAVREIIEAAIQSERNRP